MFSVIGLHSSRATFRYDILVCVDCLSHSAFCWPGRMCKLMFGVWDFFLPATFLTETSIPLSTLRRCVQLVGVHPKARVMVKVWKESRVYQSSHKICSVRVFIGRFGLHERKKRTGLVSGTGHETHWPLDPKERWYFVGKCKPPGGCKRSIFMRHSLLRHR